MAALADDVTLPRPTRDINEARADLDRHGYALIADALSADELSTLRARLFAIATAERDDGRARDMDNGQSQHVAALLNKGKPFIDLVQHPVAMELMPHLLGDDFILSSLTAIIKGPGGRAQMVHADQAFLPEPWTYAGVANVIWMLDDFVEVRGATRVVPGSHLLGRNPPGGDYTKATTQTRDERPKTIGVEAPAGTALVFDGRLWHCGGGNRTSDERRHALLSYYARPFLRTQENHYLSLDPAIRAEAQKNPLLKRLLGFEIYTSLGNVSS